MIEHHDSNFLHAKNFLFAFSIKKFILTQVKQEFIFGRDLSKQLAAT